MLTIKLNENTNSGMLYAIAYCEDPDIYSEDFWGWDTESDVGYELMEFGSLIQDADVFDSLEAAEDRADDVLSSIFEDEVFIVGLDPYTPHNLTGFVKKVTRDSINESKSIKESAEVDRAEMIDALWYAPYRSKLYRDVDTTFEPTLCKYLNCTADELSFNNFDAFSDAMAKLSDSELMNCYNDYVSHVLSYLNMDNIPILTDDDITLLEGIGVSVGSYNFYDAEDAINTIDSVYFNNRDDKNYRIALNRIIRSCGANGYPVDGEFYEETYWDYERALELIDVLNYINNKQVNESKSIKESGISEVEPVVKFKGKSSHTFTPDKKWEIDFDEEGNVLARTRHGKLYYFSGHINNKTNEFGHTDEDVIIQAAREQHKLKFGKNDLIKDKSKSIKESSTLSKLVKSGYTRKEIQKFFKDETGLDMTPENSEEFKKWSAKFLNSINESKSIVNIGYNPEYSSYIEEVAQRIDAGEYDDTYEVCEYVAKKFNKDINTVRDDINKLINDSKFIKESIVTDSEYTEVAYICDGFTKFRVYGGGFKTSDALVAVEDEKGKRLRLTMGDVCEFYTWYDAKGNVIHEPTYYSED